MITKHHKLDICRRMNVLMFHKSCDSNVLWERCCYVRAHNSHRARVPIVSTRFSLKTLQNGIRKYSISIDAQVPLFTSRPDHSSIAVELLQHSTYRDLTFDAVFTNGLMDVVAKTRAKKTRKFTTWCHMTSYQLPTECAWLPNIKIDHNNDITGTIQLH